MKTLRDNWDGYGSLAPSDALIAYAHEVFIQMRANVLGKSVRWQEPHFSVNERGQITLEWWQGKRTLTIFFRSLDQIDYLRSWGNNIETEMEDSRLIDLQEFIPLFGWLNNDG